MSTIDDLERRRFLQLMAASAALATGACSGPPPEAIVPYVDTPPELAHSDPLFYATAYVRGGYGHGVLVESNFGRPTKVEGNPDHPASLGATDVFAQASVLELWDPERSRAVYNGGALGTWGALDGALLAALSRLEASGGAGLRILTEPTTSPVVLATLRRVLAKFPGARWHTYSPTDGGHAREGAQLAFGRALDTVCALDRARIVVAFDADFLIDGPGAVRYARDFASRRAEGAAATRLYVAEASPTLAGANADERLALAPMEIERLVWRLAAQLGAAPAGVYPPNAAASRWESAVAKALRENRGASVLFPGGRLTAQTHALVHRLNAHLGNAGNTVQHIEPAAAEGAPLRELASDMHAGKVAVLLALGVNPVYDAPADFEFSKALKTVGVSLHSGLYRDETARAATWHAPQPHVYEEWSAARAYDGTLSVVQPVVRPLYTARSANALLSRVAAAQAPEDYDQVRRAFREFAAGEQWRESLRRGVVTGTAHPRVSVDPRAAIEPPKLSDEPLVAVFTASARMYDGRYANNAWLQELPHPLTNIVWDNAVMLGPRTAARFQVQTGDVVRARAGRHEIECAVEVWPTHAEAVATFALGYGRSAAGDVGNGIGFDAYALTADDVSAMLPLTMEKTGRTHRLVRAQVMMDLHGRDHVRAATVREFATNPHFANDEIKERVPRESLYPEEYAYPTYAWGMAIDLNACIGCGACTIACQAENNIPVVGRSEVEHGREMHWIRVDHYTSGLPGGEHSAFMPVPCMHCEKAPCEEVCPVGATLHDSEGLNLQVYNRCVGTRFCNQNCPYKVRRFNFLAYAEHNSPAMNPVRNPEVTVRRRGVMEKCTYCVQRISSARIQTEKEGRRIRDGEVVTACQAACPTRAIHFGDLNDPASAVRKVKASPLNYTLLAELNTRPRTTYLAKVRNPDPELKSA
jgi:molybdopterin-containing oxidoreductase family iron-sulfur binding subunit